MRQGSGFRFAALAVAALAVAGCSSSGRSPDLGAAGRTPGSGELASLGRSQLIGLLGPADFTRIDGPAELMQYRNGTCTLDVFLHDQGSGGETRVTHVEARDANMDAVSEDMCLKSVVRG